MKVFFNVPTYHTVNTTNQIISILLQFPKIRLILKNVLISIYLTNSNVIMNVDH